MIFLKSTKKVDPIPDLLSSILYNETTFYNKFKSDLFKAEKEVIIESPFITLNRLNSLKSNLELLIHSEVKVFVITRDPKEHEDDLAYQSEMAIQYFERMGVQVLLMSGGHHRKIVMIDRKILFEGSLNILSQGRSREVMRRIESKILTEEMFIFLKYSQMGI